MAYHSAQGYGFLLDAEYYSIEISEVQLLTAEWDAGGFRKMGNSRNTARFDGLGL